VAQLFRWPFKFTILVHYELVLILLAIVTVIAKTFQLKQTSQSHTTFATDCAAFFWPQTKKETESQVDNRQHAVAIEKEETENKAWQ